MKQNLITFKVLLILFGLIKNNKIHNFINKELGEKLRGSPDEDHEL